VTLNGHNDGEILIWVSPACNVTPDKIDALRSLVNQCIGVLDQIRIPPLEGSFQPLRELRILPATEMIESVQEAARDLVPSAVYHPAGGTSVAVTLPIETDGETSAIIFVSADQLDAIGPDGTPDLSLLSTVLEELLHVRLYSARQEQSLLHLTPGQPPCTRDLLILACNLHDEYAVSRLKAEILAQLTEKTSDGQYVFSLAYGLDLGNVLDESFKDLSTAFWRVAHGELPVDQFWALVVDCIYHGILDPLSRETAFRAVVSARSPAQPDISGHWFFRESIAGYWKSIESLLERSFDTDFREMGAAIEGIAETIRKLLAHLGASYEECDGTCVVLYNTHFFQRYWAL